MVTKGRGSPGFVPQSANVRIALRLGAAVLNPVAKRNHL